jgi:hypothetical protein
MHTNSRFTVNCHADVWLWTGKGAWHFVTLPVQTAVQLKEIDQIGFLSLTAKPRRGWGSIPVTVKVGGSIWGTSIFPDKKSGSYFLPLKSSIRNAEQIAVNDTLAIELSIPMP